MRKKNALLVVLLSLLFLGGCVVQYLWQEYKPPYIPKEFSSMEYEEVVMGIPVVDSLDFLEGKTALDSKENPGVYFQETLLPYSSQNHTLYLSQALWEEDWLGRLSAVPGSFLCMQQDEYLDEKERAIREGHGFCLYLVSEDSYYKLSLVVSGLPVIAMSTERMEEQEKPSYEEDPDKLYFDSEDLYYGAIWVFDPGVSGGGYEITACRVRYHHKGATTANFEKKGYSLSLQDSREENIDMPLLGMRSDNSWKLNAMVTDDNRIREMTSCQIWEQFDLENEEVAEPGPSMEYVELILDGDYKGLYCLVEPVDEKKLELDGNDVLYKILHHYAFEDEDVQEAINRKWRIMSPVRIRYPEVITDYAATWWPMRDFTNKMNYNHDGFQNVAQMVYPENVYDVFMFLMVVSASDNDYKNMYFAADVKADGSYIMKQIPWDLDYTFGNVYDYNGRNFTVFDTDITHEYKPVSTDFLIQYLPGSYEDILQERWTRYRQGFLNTEAIRQLMLDNQNKLINSGVVARENARWKEYPMSTDLEQLFAFQRARMEWLDEYFGG